jgi:hypothetical protein
MTASAAADPSDMLTPALQDLGQNAAREAVKLSPLPLPAKVGVQKLIDIAPGILTQLVPQLIHNLRAQRGQGQPVGHDPVVALPDDDAGHGP